METFPSVPSLISWRRQLARLVPDSTGFSVYDSSLHVGDEARVTVRSPQDVIASRQQMVDDLVDFKQAQSRRHETAWSSIEIADIVAACLPGRANENKS